MLVSVFKDTSQRHQYYTHCRLIIELPLNQDAYKTQRLCVSTLVISVFSVGRPITKVGRVKIAQQGNCSDSDQIQMYIGLSLYPVNRYGTNNVAYIHVATAVHASCAPTATVSADGLQRRQEYSFRSVSTLTQDFIIYLQGATKTSHCGLCRFRGTT